MSEDIRVALVPLDRVTFHPHNVRRTLGDLRSLVESIRLYGVLQPIVVERRGDMLRVRAGHRRVAAARLAGLRKIPAMIHTVALDDQGWIEQSIQENYIRRNMSNDERIDAVKALLDLGCNIDGVAGVFGVRTSTARGWLYGNGDKKRTYPPKINGSTVRSFARRWRAHIAAGNEVTVDELLDAVDRLGEAANLAAGLPPAPPPEEVDAA